MYPPIDGQQPIHPSQMNQPGFAPQGGFQPQPQPGYQPYPQAPPNYDGNPQVITQQPSE